MLCPVERIRQQTVDMMNYLWIVELKLLIFLGSDEIKIDATHLDFLPVRICGAEDRDSTQQGVCPLVTPL